MAVYVIISVHVKSKKNLGECLDILSEEMENIENEEDKEIVIGDFNARIGEVQEIAQCGLDMGLQIARRKAEDKERWQDHMYWIWTYFGFSIGPNNNQCKGRNKTSRIV